eukprot:GHVP01016053.1.p1 GENE.GHVP01016053.1~~GHVP01016053.1.p1  ORF type:complete len:143 (+),score=8.44 GHVP01016053.1:218-646(+)
MFFGFWNPQVAGREHSSKSPATLPILANELPVHILPPIAFKTSFQPEDTLGNLAISLRNPFVLSFKSPSMYLLQNKDLSLLCIFPHANEATSFLHFRSSTQTQVALFTSLRVLSHQLFLDTNPSFPSLLTKDLLPSIRAKTP